MTTIRGTMTGAAALGAAGLAAMAIAVAWPSSNEIGSSSSSLEAAPAWFKPIAQSYGDTRVTPSFDFASLYAVPDADYFAPIARYYHDGVGSQFDFAQLYTSPQQPAWFEPIARYYGGRVGSDFDFAALYAGTK